MAGMTNYLEDWFLGLLMGVMADPPPSALYLALLTAPPADDDGDLTGIEVTGGSYAQQMVTFDAPANGTMVSNAAVNFTDMPGVLVTHVALVGDGTTPLFVNALASPINVTVGSTLTFDIGDVVITVN